MLLAARFIVPQGQVKLEKRVRKNQVFSSNYRPSMTSTMEQLPQSSQRRDEFDFDLRELALRACISRENTNSRRFSASNIKSFKEEARSFRSNTTISSTTSPGYTLRDEIDPSTYSFTTALKALQARSSYGYVWECSPPDGFALNSKWNEAEKYICNPLSGEVPMECLSAKTLSGRSIPTLTSRVTMSGPLLYSCHARLVQTKPTITQKDEFDSPIQEKKVEIFTRDVGTQITPPDISSGSPSPASTPIKEQSLKRCQVEGGESPNSGSKPKSEEEIEVKEKREKEEATRKKEEMDEGEQSCKCRKVGCLSWRSLWMGRRHRDKNKPRWQV